MESLELRRLLSTTWYVDANTSGTTHDGTSWSTAYNDLQQALTKAVSGDAIHVAQGIYKPGITNSGTSFQLMNGVELDGGYAGTTSPTPDLRNVAAYPTVLAANARTIGTDYGATYHVITFNYCTSATILDGVTITGGDANNVINRQSGLYGGGALVTGGNPVFNDCMFIRNGADQSGGAICDFGASPTVTDCSFIANGGGDGGAIYNDSSSSPTLVNCIFSANTAGRGAGVFDESSSAPKLINCTFTGNEARDSGGAIYNNSASPIVTNCILWGNFGQNGVASAIAGSGGTVTRSDVEGGFAGTGNISIDPLFVRNPDRGPDGLWATADDDHGDLRIMAYSPVVDRGNNSAVPASITTDLAGNSRIQDIPTAGTTTPTVDMGAYEAAPSFSASPGGPYRVIQNHPTTFIAHGASDVAGALQYAWDLNNDGVFDDGTAQGKVFSATSTLGTFPISLRITDAASRTLIVSTTLTVLPAIAYVDATAPGPAHDGSSWNTAYNSLADALTDSVVGQRINVAQGTYKPTTTTDRTLSFQLKSGVSVYGGYAGYGAPNPDARDVIAHPTILSGDIGTVGNFSDNALHVVNTSYTDRTTVLDGVVIADGNAGIAGEPGVGGGGGMINWSGSPTLNQCTFTGNGGSNGGAMDNLSSSPTLTDCTFIRNSADEGGAIDDFSGCSPVLTNCIFIGNHASYGGGAFYTYYTDSLPVLTDCIFHANSADYEGGAMFDYYCSPIIAQCIFVGNSSDQDGGAIYNQQASPTLFNCAVSANSAQVGGGIYDDSNSLAKLRNSVLWGNAASISGPQIYDASYSSVDHSDVSFDAKFYRNPSSGADGTWGTADDDYGDLRLLPNSPCIDAGSNSAVTAGVTTDIAGNPRIVDFPGVHDPGAIVDMGAYEASTNLGAMHLTSGQNVALPAGHHAFSVSQLTLDPGATFDLKNNSLVVDYTSDSPLGSWDSGSSVYTGLTGAIQSGAIFSSAAVNRSTTLGIAESSNVLGLTGSATSTWGGQTVDSTAVLIKFTYAGDANLDGKINIDDYGRIDANVGQSGTVFGWYNGDFNFDGKINIDDYGLIDSVIGSQGPVL